VVINIVLKYVYSTKVEAVRFYFDFFKSVPVYTLRDKNIMTNNPQKVKAEVAKVQLGTLEIDGLLLSDDNFAIAI